MAEGTALKQAAGRPSKLTAQLLETLTQALRVGASRETACAIVGVDITTFYRWMREAESSPRHAEFRDAVLQAEAHPKMRALGVVYKAVETRPDLAWKFIERREKGYAPPQPDRGPAAAPVVVSLTFQDGMVALPPSVVDGFIEGEASEQDVPAGAGPVIELPAVGEPA